ncbi:hypothetical protein EDD86DRAFT_222146 [Gorgonomyces haynaldii]|nr:hypothetical protein EDD86DRAFT_222146 [Gorgonomyces haynaldii]
MSTVVVVEKDAVSELLDLVDPKSPELLKKMGGLDGLVQKLQTHKETGLQETEEQMKKRREKYGTNSLPEPVFVPFYVFVWEALQDKTLIVLMIACLVEMAIGIYRITITNDAAEIIDAAAIAVAVVIVVLFGSISDYRKQLQFRALNDFGRSIDETRVIRNGQTQNIPTADIVVGDVVLISTGDVFPSDGVLISGFDLEVDESTMTGEPKAIYKGDKDPFLLSGTRVMKGMGQMIVIATGVNSLHGRSMLALEVEPEDTPLQVKLGRIADFIAKYAFFGAIGLVVLLLIIYFAVTTYPVTDSTKIPTDIIKLFIIAVAIVVVAVPEGLPLAVTLSLAHATVQMLKDNNLVRNLAACETMGNATTICSDKTGTLTINKMTVVRGQLMQFDFLYEQINTQLVDKIKESTTDNQNVAKQALDLIMTSLNINSSAEETVTKSGAIELQGSKTEIALLNFTKALGYDYKVSRTKAKILNVASFSSESKRMSTIAKLDPMPELETQMHVENIASWMFVKGASEIVLGSCSHILRPNGVIETLTQTEAQEIQRVISKFADLALRTISCAFKPIKEGETGLTEEGNLNDKYDLVLMGIFGIEDPLRPEVPEAVRQCQSAGVIVRMVTGDSVPTARAIAKGCGILTDGVVMEGPEFRKLTRTQMNEILPKLQVLARSSPLDKQILVKNLKRLGETVAVTGDGTNDAPALTAADVGFSMGIAGTSVAKEASDIILMDDNFASLVKSVIWGRCVYDSIRKFLQFQLTVNVSAVVIAFVTAFYTTVSGSKNPESVLTAIQLLWVNLIMDTLAALALASDEPTPDLLNRKPSRKNESIISPDMYRMIFAQALYQAIVCLLIYFLGHSSWSTRETDAIVFNTFIFCQLFNEFNSRSISDDVNIFKGLDKNRIFQAIILITVVLQIVIMFVGGEVFHVTPLSGSGWAVSVCTGLGSLIVGYVVRVLPPIPLPTYLTKDYELIEEPEEEMVRMDTTGTASSVERWHKAIRLTALQNRAVRAFSVPDLEKPPTPRGSEAALNVDAAEAQDTVPAQTVWEQLVQGARRKRFDQSSVQMVDPRMYNKARIAHAKKNSKTR